MYMFLSIAVIETNPMQKKQSASEESWPKKSSTPMPSSCKSEDAPPNEKEDESRKEYGSTSSMGWPREAEGAGRGSSLSSNSSGGTRYQPCAYWPRESAMLSTDASDWSVALPTPRSHSRNRRHLCASLPTGLSLLLAEKVSMTPCFAGRACMSSSGSLSPMPCSSTAIFCHTDPSSSTLVSGRIMYQCDSSPGGMWPRTLTCNVRCNARSSSERASALRSASGSLCRCSSCSSRLRASCTTSSTLPLPDRELPTERCSW
mmetsp:Transcript_8542/g.26809  ORF Transcript_8542/g.26809 Transcript_8542/m.26809 type:complete len:260 (+) Transcript_8542:1158-1937(+)